MNRLLGALLAGALVALPPGTPLTAASRTEIYVPGLPGTRGSRGKGYMPHQGHQERARRCSRLAPSVQVAR